MSKVVAVDVRETMNVSRFAFIYKTVILYAENVVQYSDVGFDQWGGNL